MENLNLGFLKEKFEDVKDEVNGLILKNGEKMYEGIFEVIDELINDKEWWDERYDEVVNDLDFDDDEDFRLMVLSDDVDRELMRRFGDKFYNNLINLGYKYEFDEDEGEGYWDIKDEDGDMDLTSYGVVWDYWYDLDTDVRESVSEIWEECFN
jgi:hypothetical protein